MDGRDGLAQLLAAHQNQRDDTNIAGAAAEILALEWIAEALSQQARQRGDGNRV